MSSAANREPHSRAEQISAEARALPAGERPAFVDRACGDDSALRREVAALLAFARSAPGPDPLSGNVAARMISDVLADSTRGVPAAHDPWIGVTVSHFEILERVGAGGMGVVYRARDSRLGRTVALKFLPWSLCSDAEAKARFIHEAQAVSALDHVSITAIHEIGETPDGQLFIAMAFHSGETLRQMIARGPLPGDKASDYVRQLASALSRAHAQGIIHRDIKPANVIVTTDGVAKLLDFGIAKLAGGTSVTRTGTTVGTAPYMSPEQARGDAVDHRTDLWSLGVVWYEMLCGQRPFQGDSVPAILNAILERDPPSLQDLHIDVPAGITAILRGCLAKDPAQRYQTADELSADLQRIREGLAPAKRRVRRVWTGQTGGRRARLVAGATILAAAIVGVLIVRRSPEATPVFSNPRQVSSSTALEDYPAISPDGRTVAYESNEAGKWDIWVSQPGAEAPVNRTASLPGNHRYPSWAPDGRVIAFWSDHEGGGYHVMPAFGGPAQPLVPTSNLAVEFFSPAAWSADGRTLGVVQYRKGEHEGGPVIALVDLTTRDTQTFALPGNEEARLDPAWSPDGSMIAYVDAAQQPAETTTLRVLHLATGAAITVTDGSSNVRNPMWRPDSRTLLFASDRSGPSDLWMCRLTEAGALADPPRQITTAMDIRHASVARDVAALAYAKGRWVANIWRVPIRRDRPATWAEAEAVTSEYAFIEFLALSPDGKRLAFSTDRRGNQDIWTMSAGGGELTRLTSHPAKDWGPDWSPDGSQIAFYSNRTGDREIWVMAADGEPATRISHSPGLDAGPRWSPNGRELVWRSERRGNSDIWVAAVDGSGDRQITDDPAGDYAPVFSPDGAWIYFYSLRSGQRRLWRIPASGGDAEPVSADGISGSLCWSPDGRFLYCTNWLDSPGNLWALSLDDRQIHPITDLSGRRGGMSMQAPATDGHDIYFSWREDLGDVWVMDVSYK